MKHYTAAEAYITACLLAKEEIVRVINSINSSALCCNVKLDITTPMSSACIAWLRRSGYDVEEHAGFVRIQWARDCMCTYDNPPEIQFTLNGGLPHDNPQTTPAN